MSVYHRRALSINPSRLFLAASSHPGLREEEAVPSKGLFLGPTNSEAHSFGASAVKGSGKAVEFALAVLMAFLEP